MDVSAFTADQKIQIATEVSKIVYTLNPEEVLL